MNKTFKYLLGILLDFFEITLVCTLVAIIVHFYVGQLLEVSGDSMYPTIKDREDIVAEKLSVKYGQIERGDIVIFEHPEEKGRLIIKRVIGMPGEKIAIRNGKVYINEEALKEPYLGTEVSTYGHESLKEDIVYTIPADNYVVLGDNRTKSTDSRNWGFLPRKELVGKPFAVFFPLKNIRIIRN